jgi:hypothetical protein
MALAGSRFAERAHTEQSERDCLGWRQCSVVCEVVSEVREFDLSRDGVGGHSVDVVLVSLSGAMAKAIQGID